MNLLQTIHWNSAPYKLKLVSLVVVSSVVGGDWGPCVVSPGGGGDMGGEGLQAVRETLPRRSVHVVGSGKTQVWEVVSCSEGRGACRESGIGPLMACLIGDMHRQVGAHHPEATLASCVVLYLKLAVGIDVAEGATHVAVGVSGFLAGGYARVIAEGILAKLILHVILRPDGDDRFGLRHRTDVLHGGLLYDDWGLVYG